MEEIYKFVTSIMTRDNGIFYPSCNTGCLRFNAGWSRCFSGAKKKREQAMQWRNINASNNSVHANASKTHRITRLHQSRCIRSLAARLYKLTDPHFSPYDISMDTRHSWNALRVLQRKVYFEQAVRCREQVDTKFAKLWKSKSSRRYTN